MTLAAIFEAPGRFWLAYRALVRQMADDQAAGICPHCRKNPIAAGESDCAECHGEMSPP